ncbi:heavy metal translocating P-type ATPase [Glaciecola punicea]|nr:cation-translocating P-type ATPase [Glaciecola punicea]
MSSLQSLVSLNMHTSANISNAIDDNTAPERDAKKNSAIFMIEGMRCGSCAIAIEALLNKQPNVSEATVNFSADIAMIHWKLIEPDILQLERAVKRLGYSLHTSICPKRSAEQADKTRKLLQMRLAVAVVFGMWSMMPAILLYLAPFGAVEHEYMWPLALASGLFAIPVVLYSGSHFYRVGLRTLLAAAPGLDTLITLAVVAACIVSVWQLKMGQHHVYFDAAVMLITFQLIARLMDSSVRRRASDIVQGYFHTIPETVNVFNEAGEISKKAANTLTLGKIIVLSAGQKLALDGVVKSGAGQADVSLLTGEHAPQPMIPGNELLAGCTLLEGELQLIVTAGVGERRIDRLSHSISGLLSRKMALQQLTDRIARWLIPVIVVSAILAVVLATLQGESIMVAVGIGVAVLIVSCPCALSLAIPMVITMGYSGMLQQGIVLRDPAALEAAADINAVVFDKTGTLTTAEPSIHTVLPAPGWNNSDLLQLAMNILHDSLHPTAKGLQASVAKSLVPVTDGHRESKAGEGTVWKSTNGVALAGRASWLRQQGVSLPTIIDNGMQLHLANQGRYAGSINFQETVREGAVETVTALHQQGLDVYLLSGDTQQSCYALAERMSISKQKVFFEHTPEQKHQFVETLEKSARVAFVGDGLNDGLALAGARLGIAVGRASSATAMAAAVYLPNSINRVPATLLLAQKARTLMYQNLFWALTYNVLLIPLAVWGWVHPVIAALAMSLSSLCVLFNSMRMQRRYHSYVSSAD